MSTEISWTDETWNPTTGCDRISPGCDNCYALGMAKRLKAMGQAKYQKDGDPRTSGPGFGLTVHPDALDLPLRWKRPRRIFVNSMSDLFHPDVPDQFIADVVQVMTVAKQHTFQVLTKRPQRMAKLFPRISWDINGDSSLGRFTAEELCIPNSEWYDFAIQLPNVWWGTSIESDRWAFRADHLRATPAAVRFLSCEPLLGALPSLDLTGIDWLIAGGESGRHARPMHPDWVRDLRDRCVLACVPFHFKQWGTWAPLGPVYDQVADYDEEADDARMMAASYEVHRILELERDGTTADGYQPDDGRTWLMAHEDKKASGRELDGRTWDEFPA